MLESEKIAGLKGAINVTVDDHEESNPMGYQIEAHADRPFTDDEMKKLERYAHCLSWIINLDEKEGALDVGLTTIYKSGRIVTMASSEYDMYRHMDQTMQAMARCFNCTREIGDKCGWKCVVRCDEHVLTKGEDGVDCDRDGCVYCRRCFGECPLVVYRERNPVRGPPPLFFSNRRVMAVPWP